MAPPPLITDDHTPWLANEAWRDGRVVSSSKAEFLLIAVIALLWNGFVGLFLAFAGPDMWSKFKDGNYAVALVVLFPLVGAFLAFRAVLGLISWRKFGTCVFEMSTFPGVIGGRLSGTIRTRIEAPMEGPIYLELACVNVRMIATRDTTEHETNVRLEEDKLWQEVQAVEADRCVRGPDGIAIPVDFAVPSDCRPWNENDPEDRIVWRLALHVSVKGLDLRKSFEVPVCQMSGSRSETDRVRVARLR